MDLDIYHTGNRQVDSLLENINIYGSIFECCSGEGHISKYLGSNVIINDIRHNGFDARNHIYWSEMNPKPDWTITNPPFSSAYRILCNALAYSNTGVAFLLRLSFLEPTIERESLLVRQPPNKLLVLPRFSFSRDGKTDSVTTAWMIWDKSKESYIKIIPRKYK